MRIANTLSLIASSSRAPYIVSRDLLRWSATTSLTRKAARRTSGLLPASKAPRFAGLARLRLRRIGRDREKRRLGMSAERRSRVYRSAFALASPAEVVSSGWGGSAFFCERRRAEMEGQRDVGAGGSDS